MSLANFSDQLASFHLQSAGVRGVHVHLGETWQQIHSRAAYSAPVRELLGEACAAAALLTAHIKFDGRLSLQIRGRGVIRTLFAECTAAGTLRGIAQIEEPGDAAENAQSGRLLVAPVLAITIENPRPGRGDPMRYQGLVSIESDRLSRAVEQYFEQSEQLPSRMVLGTFGGQAVGLLIQKLPGDTTSDEDGWERACALLDTLSPQELLLLDRRTLLHRLFHDEDLVVTAVHPMRFACSCSRSRVEAVLVALGQEEALASAASGKASVLCEFCGTDYTFTLSEIAAIFEDLRPSLPAPDRLQ